MMTAAEAVEAAKGLTFEKVWAMFQENREQMKEMSKEADRRWEKASQERREMSEEADRRQAEIDRRWEKASQERRKMSEEADRRQAEIDRRWEKASQERREMSQEADRRQAEADRRQAEADRRQAEIDRRQEEVDRRQAEADRRQAESDRQWAELKRLQAENVALVKELSKNIGGLNNSLGRWAEEIVSAKLWEKFDAIGYTFTQGGPHKFWDGRRTVAQVDMLLENGEYAMPVEIKAELTAGDVEDHLKRIQKVREELDKRGDTRKLVGAVAGMVVPEKVRDYAQARGLYVLVQSGDTVALAEPPEDFRAREW